MKRPLWLLRLGAIAVVSWTLPHSASAGDTTEGPAEHRTPQKTEDPLTLSLKKRLRQGSSLDDVMIDVRWRFEDEYVSTRLFGNGVGIWKKQVLFRIPRAEARKLIGKVTAAHFGALPSWIGEEEARVLTGRIIVVSGAITKAVSQAAEGPQSPALADIARSLLVAGKGAAARGGTRVSSFAEGFGAQAGGRLAPEALDLFLHRKALAETEERAEDWEVRLRGRRMFDRVIQPDSHGAVTRELVLSAADFEGAARELAAADVGSLPQNLYAPIYTDLDITLLDQHKNIQARQFAGMTEETNGPKQHALDRLLKFLVSLHERAVATGRVVAAADLVDFEGEKESREHAGREKDTDKHEID